MDYIAQQQRNLFQRNINVKSFAEEILQSRRKISLQSYRSKTQPYCIDKQLVYIIKQSNKKNPNRLSLLLKSKGFQLHNQQAKDFNLLKPAFQNRFFSDQYSREQTKFIKSSQKQYNSRQSIKRKLKGYKIKGKPFHDLTKGSILYFEKNNITEKTVRGRYREVLHPLCGLYQKQAERTLRSRLRLADPFQQEQQ